MEQHKNSGFLKIALFLFIVVALLNGIVYLFAPQVVVEASGGDPVPSGWLRWMGAIILALGIGGIMVYSRPQHQGIFVSTLALGSLLGGLALVFSALVEPEGIGNVWHTLIPAIVLVLLSVLCWISLKKAKEILFG